MLTPPHNWEHRLGELDVDLIKQVYQEINTETLKEISKPTRKEDVFHRDSIIDIPLVSKSSQLEYVFAHSFLPVWITNKTNMKVYI